jgi:hypothetical protein
MKSEHETEPTESPIRATANSILFVFIIFVHLESDRNSKIEIFSLRIIVKAGSSVLRVSRKVVDSEQVLSVRRNAKPGYSCFLQVEWQGVSNLDVLEPQVIA